jgi:hypothetical protein
MSKRIAQFSPNSDPNPKRDRNNSKLIFVTPPTSSTPRRPVIAAPNPQFQAQILALGQEKDREQENPEDTEKTEETLQEAEEPMSGTKDRFEDSIDSQLHNSMNQIPNETNKYSAPPIEFVLIDINKKDDLPFDGVLPRESLKQLWTTLGRKIGEVKILSFQRYPKRYLRVIYNIKNSIAISDITHSYELQAEITANHSSAIYNIRFPQFRELVCELGQLITVTFHKVPPEVSCTDIRNWLNLFGVVEGGFRYKLIFYSSRPPPLFFI